MVPATLLVCCHTKNTLLGWCMSMGSCNLKIRAMVMLHIAVTAAVPLRSSTVSEALSLHILDMRKWGWKSFWY